LLCDIDRHSIYHPANHPELWDALLYHLEQIGLIDPIVSSAPTLAASTSTTSFQLVTNKFSEVNKAENELNV
jgi:hypothetical protein